MAIEAWLAVGFGFVFVVLMATVAIWITVTGRNPPQAAMFFFRVIIALAAAGVGAVLPGLLEVGVTAGGLTIRATCGLALFVIIYLVNPRILPTVGTSPDPVVGPIIEHSRERVDGP
jgi:hypothetical protein